LRFVNPTADQKKVVLLSRLATVLVFLMSGISTYWLYQAGSIEGAWRIIIALGAGTGLVYILRWYWWRINAWSEISAMAAALVTFSILTFGGIFDPVDALEGAYLMLATTAVTTVVWLTVTLMTAPTARGTLEAFYRRVRPVGPGWRAVRQDLGLPDEPIAGGALSWVNWLAGVVAVYSTLFGIGKLIFGPRMLAVIYLAVAAIAFAIISRNLKIETYPEFSAAD